jgi:hypothetical protein
MTSLADERGETTLTRPAPTEPLALAREPSALLAQHADHVVARFAEAFDRAPVETAPDALGVALSEPARSGRPAGRS